MRARRSWIVWGLFLAVGACSPADVPRAERPAPPTRPPDGLLGSPALQEVVDAQLRRDGAGLRRLLTDSDPAVRARAALAFATLRDLGAAPQLRALLSDPDPRVRTDAAFALSHYPGAGDAGDQFGDLLATEADPTVREAFIDALGKAAYSRSLWILLGLGGADRPSATLALSRAVIRGAAPAGAVDSLVARLVDPDPAVRRNAAYFMERVDDPLVWVDARREIRSGLDALSLDDPAAMSLVDGLGLRADPASRVRIVHRARWASDWRVRANAMAALGGMGADDARAGALLGGLDDPSPHVRARAAEVLAASPVDPALGNRFRDWIQAHPGELLAVGPLLAWLARAGDADTVLGWVDGLAPDDEAGWVLAAVPALGELRDRASLGALRAAASSPTPRVARSAAAALARRTGVEAAPPTGGGASVDEPPTLDPPSPSVDWNGLAALGARPRLILETERGTVVLELAADLAPLTVQRLTGLARTGRFDGVPFHRVVPNFVIQGGDLTRAPGGGTAAPPLLSEIVPIPFERGVVGMANTGALDTETSQFFITHDRQPHLDGGYTAFGWVLRGMEVVDRIQPGDRIVRALVRGGPRDPSS